MNVADSTFEGLRNGYDVYRGFSGFQPKRKSEAEHKNSSSVNADHELR